ncbi:MAG TPA: inactive transglutaminase family protein [Gammaproteobacteria bacterium]|nr:inactive transglutaminase family protein [Gammaproteobacteria bacterium]
MRQDASNRALRNVVLALVAISLGVFAFKVLVLGFPLLAKRGAESWNVEAKVAFTARGKPVKVALLVPRDSPGFVVNDEAFVSRNYGITIGTPGGNRRVLWSVRKAAGRQVLYYRAVVRRLPAGANRREPPGPVPEKPDFSGAGLTAAQSLIEESKAHSADLETLVPQVLRQLGNRQDGRVRVLLGRNPTPQKRADVAAELLTLAGHPARVVHGIRLRELERDAPVVEWLQVYGTKRWQSFNAESGAQQTPEDFLPWWYGAGPLVKVSGGNRVETGLAVARSEETALGGATERGRELAPRLLALSLLSLPIETQLVYRVMLLVPVGAFILVLMRNVVGFKTFGTFMPVLIALAFRQTQLLWGVILFSVLVALGLVVRFYLERLKLLLVPRLAAVLIVVVLLMAGLSVISHRWGLPQGLSVALFPMVILTMTIERMSIVWEERGGGEAVQQGLGSLAVASLAYLVINLAWLQHLIFVFPELLLLLLAGILLLGRYSGYRLSELRRFKALSGESR